MSVCETEACEPALWPADKQAAFPTASTSWALLCWGRAASPPEAGLGRDPAASLRKGCAAVWLPGNLNPPGRSEAQTKLIRAQLCEGFLPVWWSCTAAVHLQCALALVCRFGEFADLCKQKRKSQTASCAQSTDAGEKVNVLFQCFFLLMKGRGSLE